MTINNSINLIGNLGNEASIIETVKATFASASLATTDSYKDKNSDEWKTKQSQWHNIVAFSPKQIASLKSLKKGTRVKVEGSLSYRPFTIDTETHDAEGNPKKVTKYQASIIVRKIELAPLPKKS